MNLEPDDGYWEGSGVTVRDAKIQQLSRLNKPKPRYCEGS